MSLNKQMFMTSFIVRIHNYIILHDINLEGSRLFEINVAACFNIIRKSRATLKKKVKIG